MYMNIYIYTHTETHTHTHIHTHMYIFDTCAGDCFQLCERKVSSQMAAHELDGQEGSGGGRGRVVEDGRRAARDGRSGGGRGERGEGGRGGGGRDGRGGTGRRGKGGYGRDTLVLPAKLNSDSSLFGSATWQVGVAVISLATLGVGFWSTRRM